jgi:hypothetical protein
MMRFKLDGNIVDSPKNWEEVNTTIKRDPNVNLFLLYQEYNLEFADSGHAYLSNLSVNDSFCTQVSVTIEVECNQQWSLIFDGFIFLSDCEFNERACTVNCKVNDKSFFSKINNNKSIKTSLEGAYTKNKEAITVTEQYDLDVYRVSDGTTLIRTVPTCRVEEAFRYMVDFMTDNTVGFTSTSFGAGGTWEGLCITTGERLRGVVPNFTTGRWVQFSFIELFNEINNRIPIILLVENPFTTPVVRIETIDYLYDNTTVFTASDVYEVVTSYDNDKLYAIVKFGSPTDDTFSDFPDDIDYFGYKSEEFHVLGNCNLDLTLDLSSDWVVSTNIIQRCAQTGVQDYDSNLFIIDSIYTDDFNGRTTNDNFLNSVPARYHYNARLNNDNISQRYLPDIANSIASYYINSQEGQMYAYLSGALAHTVLTNNEDFQQFIDVESYDFGNYYDTVTRTYTAAITGVYTFKAQVTLLCGAGTGSIIGNLFRMLLEHYDASNVLINAYDIHNSNLIFNGVGYLRLGPSPGSVVVKTLNNTAITMTAGDYLRMRILSWPNSNGPGQPIFGGQVYSVLSGASNTFMQCVDTTITGGVFLDADPNDIKVQLHRFNYPMSQSQFDTILANPIGRIQFNMEGQSPRFGWIKELKYNHTNGVAEFIVSTSKATQNGGS